MNDFNEYNYLCHYGIKGMKWGVRRYQNKDGSLTELGKKRYRKGTTGMSMYAGMALVGDERKITQDMFKEVRYGTREDGSEHWDSPVAFRQERFRQEYLDNPDTVFNDVVHNINKTHGEEQGTTNNCTKCASAMILAKKGYEFDAGRSNRGYGEAFQYWFDGAEKGIYDNLQEATDNIAKTSAGDYGTIDMRNQNGGGHVFNWDHKSDGSFGVYDGQTGDIYKGDTIEDCMNQYLEDSPWFDRNDRVVTNNMTNAEPNWDHMAEDSVVRVNDGNMALTKQTDIYWNGGYVVDENRFARPNEKVWLNQETIDRLPKYARLD